MKRHLVILCISITVFYGCGNKALKYYNKGVREFEKEEYSNAIEHLEEAVALGAPEKNAEYYLAESYRLSNRIHDAEPYYKKAIQAGNNDDHVHFYYGYAQKANGNYEGAEKTFKRYVRSGTNFDYINRAKHELHNLKELKKIANKTTSYEVRNYTELNTEVIDYSPMMHGRELYFTSSRGEGIIFPGQGTRFTDIYEFKFDGITPYTGQAIKITDKINAENTHEATPTFTDGGKTMVFSRSNDGKKESVNPTQVVDLFITFQESGIWTEPQRLPFNQNHSWDSAPCFSPDGKTLYYSSNRDGGFGATDIWKVERLDQNEWGEPENLGPLVNTEGEESFPYLDPDGTLYFSSDGHVGFGELDIFFLKKVGKKRVVENIGKPINSSHDDFAITFHNNELGYFTSNRPDGKGDDDIYIFEVKIKQFLEILVTGKVLDPNYIVTNEEKILPNATIVVVDTVSKKDIGTFSIDDKGIVRIPVVPGAVYKIDASHPDFEPNSKLFSMIGKEPTADQIRKHEDITHRTKVVLTPKIIGKEIKLDPIFYPYDKWNITAQAKKVLDIFVEKMEKNPTLVVELGSHTDPRNTIKYNDLLSQRRAESAVKYVLSKGVEKRRIYARGYGERKPLTLRKDTLGLKAGMQLTHKFILDIKDKKVRSDAFQLNRRTEFRIVDIIPKEFNENEIEVVRNGEVDEVIEERKVKNEEINFKRLENRKN